MWHKVATNNVHLPTGDAMFRGHFFFIIIENSVTMMIAAKEKKNNQTCSSTYFNFKVLQCKNTQKKNVISK